MRVVVHDQYQCCCHCAGYSSAVHMCWRQKDERRAKENAEKVWEAKSLYPSGKKRKSDAINSQTTQHMDLETQSPSHWLYITLALIVLATSLYFSLHYTTMDLLETTWHNITIAQFHSSWLYMTVHYSTMNYFTLLHSALLYYLSTSLLYHGCTSLYLILQYSTMALLDSTWLYITLPLLYFTLLDSILYATMALLCSTWLYTLRYTMALLCSTWLY